MKLTFKRSSLTATSSTLQIPQTVGVQQQQQQQLQQKQLQTTTTTSSLLEHAMLMVNQIKHNIKLIVRAKRNERLRQRT